MYRPAVAVDGTGRVWVIYSEHRDADKHLDHGNWELMAHSYDASGKEATEPVNISNEKGPDFMPVATTDSNGNVWLAWVGGRDASYNIFTSHQDGGKFTKAARLEAEGNEWEPAIAAGANGEITVAWDTYGKGDYDVYLCAADRAAISKSRRPSRHHCSLKFARRLLTTSPASSGLRGKSAATNGAKISAD